MPFGATGIRQFPSPQGEYREEGRVACNTPLICRNVCILRMRMLFFVFGNKLFCVAPGILLIKIVQLQDFLCGFYTVGGTHFAEGGGCGAGA